MRESMNSRASDEERDDVPTAPVVARQDTAVTDAQRPTADEERELVIAAEAGSDDARRRLVDAFLPAIVGLAQGFRTKRGVETQELVQEGVVGLLSAAERYDTALSTPVWAYASFWVRKAMQRLIAERSHPVALSDRAVRELASVRAACKEHRREHGVEPTNRHLSRVTGLTLEQIGSLLATERLPRGIEEALQIDGTSATLGDTLPDPTAEEAYSCVLDNIQRRELYGLLGCLNGRERTVILAHYGLGQPAQTLSQIGVRMGVSAERARQIEVAALTRLRQSLVEASPSGAA
jgi:RNA polymerase sigma factor (sigma-70 family)